MARAGHILRAALIGLLPALAASGQSPGAAPAPPQTQPAPAPRIDPSLLAPLIDPQSPPAPPQLTPGHLSARPPAQTAAPVEFKATLTVQAVQGTPDGAPVAGDKITVKLYPHDHSGHTHGPGGHTAEHDPRLIEATLDETGTAILEDLPVVGAAIPTVAVAHGGTEFMVEGRLLTPAARDQFLKITVYETTQTRPDWRVEQWHVRLQSIEGGFYVEEIASLLNPADRAWIGQADSQSGPRTTFAVDLPPSFTQRADFIDGFDPDAVWLTSNRITSGRPMLPGRSSYRYSYLVPYVEGTAELMLTAPAEAANLIVMVPQDAGRATADGLEAGQPMAMMNQAIQPFYARDIPAGGTVTLRIVQPGAPAAPLAIGRSRSIAGTLAIIGGGAVVLVGLALIWFKTAGRPRQPGQGQAE